MWYSYNLTDIKENKMKEFTKDFKEVMLKLFEGDELYFAKLNIFKSTKLKTYLDEIKTELSLLKEEEKMIYINIFKNNYKIEELLINKSRLYTYKYLKIRCGNKIAQKTEDLCTYLYENFKDLSSFSKKYVSPKDYYNTFLENEIIKGICPFCGENEMETENVKGRPDFDHYLLKAKYPFISMHYKNLVPMCHSCNSKTYKGEKDILAFEKAYYPYNKKYWKNFLKIEKIKHGKEIKLENFFIINEANCKENRIENDSWNKIFDIDNRVKEKVRVNQKEVIDDIYREIEFRKLSSYAELEKEISEKILRMNKYRYRGGNLYKESLLKYYLKNLDFFKEVLRKNKIDK